MKRLSLVIFVSMSLMGCSTMNKAQCRNADWNMIGLEDGLTGKAPSYIGKHRTACAKFNVTPDLEEYRMGYAEGLKAFCTPEKGLALGMHGSIYHGACPSELAGPFLENYNQGKQLYFKLREVEDIADDIEDHQKDIVKLTDEMDAKKNQLISNGTSEGDRAILLREIESLQSKVSALEKKIVWKRSQRKQLEEEARDMKVSLGLTR